MLDQRGSADHHHWQPNDRNGARAGLGYVKQMGVGLLIAAGLGCDDLVEPSRDADVFVSASFHSGLQGWSADLADYPPHNLEGIGFQAEHRAPSGSLPGGYYLSGLNLPDDLFMFIKRSVDGLEGGAAYRIEFAVEIHTNSPSNCAGVGGAPGENVYLKAGAASIEPRPVPGQTPGEWVRMNVDKGNQEEEGADAINLGHVGNGLDCITEWRSKELTSAEDFVATSDSNGTLWLFVGTDSGYEGRTEIMYARVRAWFWKVSTGP